MRPRIVILVLIVAIGMVALAVVLKGVMGGHATQEGKAPEPPSEEPSDKNAVIPQGNPVSSNTAVALEQLRAAELAKGLEGVRELQTQGAGDPSTIEVLLSYVTHREPEVRGAAVQALVQLDATNAIPGLEQALGRTEDPHDKIVLLEALNYLKLPNEAPLPPFANPPGPEDQAPPPADVGASQQKRDPSTPRPKRERKARVRKGATPQPPPGTQPAAPVPDAAPPQ
jgi:HEAT repeats